MKLISNKKLKDFQIIPKNLHQPQIQLHESMTKLSLQQSDKINKTPNQKSIVSSNNDQKLQKRNKQMLKLFKSTPLQHFNLELLQKSQFMKNNQIFHYLVQCLKKQRQGMISIQTLTEERAKDPKHIQNKIRQFVYNSLQQSLLMSEKQLRQIKFFQRLFEWFTDVFKQRQMKLSFKKQAKKDNQCHDQDWMIRNTYKSNMPLELSNYQRKMLNMNQIVDLNQNMYQIQQGTQAIKKNISTLKNSRKTPSLDTLYNKTSEVKLFSHSTSNSPNYKKSQELFPLLNRKSLLSNLSKIRQSKDKQQLHLFQLQLKKKKTQYGQHATKNFYLKQYFKDKTLFKENSIKPEVKEKQFKLNKKVLEKIEAARLGVTLSDFRKNKENNKQNLEQFKFNTSYQGHVFHPNLTSNYFNEIKKKRIEKLVNKVCSKKNELNGSKNTQESQQLSLNGSKFCENNFQNQLSRYSFQSKSDLDQIKSVDGIGLFINPFEKISAKHNKK